MIEGRVFDIDGVVSDVHIQNVSSETYSISDVLGRFQISVKEKDTLYFSSITHKMQEMIIDFEHIEDIKDIRIYLKTNIYELNEVSIVKINMDHILQNVLGDKKTRTPNETISFYGKPRNTLVHLDKTVTGLSINLEALYHRLSGERKKKKLRQKWESQDNAIEMLRGIYSFEHISNTFKIHHSRIYEFLLYAIDTTPLKEAIYTGDKYLILKNLELSSTSFNSE